MIIQVYFNLHKKCWSLRDKRTRKIVDHKEELVLTNCELKVSEAGRRRVLRERRKNVHAWIEGTLAQDAIPNPNFGLGVRYNPYEMGCFMMLGGPVRKAAEVHFLRDRKVRASV